MTGWVVGRDRHDNREWIRMCTGREGKENEKEKTQSGGEEERLSYSDILYKAFKAAEKERDSNR